VALLALPMFTSWAMERFADTHSAARTIGVVHEAF
jgi:hypothetical protein